MKHEDLVEAARAALDALFSDKSVGPRTTIESLGELASDIETRIDALKGDLQRAGREE